MDNTIFRKKSVERISSPEQLDAYLKVTTPSVWIILCAIIVLLVGIICWAVVGTIETSEPTSCYVESNDLICYTTEDIKEKIEEGTIIKLNGFEQKYDVYSVEYIGQLTEDEEDIAHVIHANVHDYIYEVRAKCDLPDSIKLVNGKIVLEEISPIRFVFN